MISIIKKLIPQSIKYNILYKRELIKKRNSEVFDKNLLRNKNAFIFLAADYGNLGDVAITYAQQKFIEENTDFTPFLIPQSLTFEGINFVKKHIKSTDIITIVGGGNFGDFYMNLEMKRRFVIENFQKNIVISFPQTFDFSDTIQGIKFLRKTVSVYSQNSNLSVVAREKLSFRLISKYFKSTNIVMTPDIVLSLKLSDKNIERSGVVLSLRNDDEKVLTGDQVSQILNLAKREFSSLSNVDTHIGNTDLSISELYIKFQELINVYKEAELVITDRLHGMIFCYITNTPCFVFPNKNHKIVEMVNWFNDDCSIFLNRNNDLNELSTYLDEREYKKEYENDYLIKYYEPLKELFVR